MPADDRRLVAHREDGGESDPEAADRRVGVGCFGAGSLGGRAQRTQGLDTGGVQRGAGVGGDEYGGIVALARPQREPEPARHTGAGRRVCGVLGEFDDEAVAVTAQREVLLGVGVLAESGGGGGPGIEHAAPQAGRPEGIGCVCRFHDHGLCSSVGGGAGDRPGPG